jgi:ribosome-binding protein aMBF1 (putative translation factor)
MTTAKRKKTSDGLKILARITGNDPKVRAAIATQKIRCQIAETVFGARESRGLTQASLAKIARTHQSVISRIEDADDDGTVTLAMLERVLRALGLQLSLRAVPIRA